MEICDHFPKYIKTKILQKLNKNQDFSPMYTISGRIQKLQRNIESADHVCKNMKPNSDTERT